MEAAPGTEGYAQQLTREYTVLQSDLRGLKDIARIRAASSGLHYSIELGRVMVSEAGQGTQRDMEHYNAKVIAHRKAIQGQQQTRANARQAAETRAATCGTCFTQHAGECY